MPYRASQSFGDAPKLQTLASGGLEAQKLSLVQKPNRSTNVEFTTSAPIAFKPLLAPVFLPLTVIVFYKYF